jgi:hypothetical protein
MVMAFHENKIVGAVITMIAVNVMNLKAVCQPLF